MKKLLVPTDFSKTAENALNFAVLLAQRTNAKITLIHVFQLPVVITEIPFEILQEERMDKKKEVEEKLVIECSKWADQTKIEYRAIEGTPIDSILEFSKDNSFDYIILGTNGAGKHTAGFFGSTTSHVVEKANCPVIAIPESNYFRNGIKKITFATDYHLSDIAFINKLSYLASLFNAQLNILHVSLTDLSTEEEIKLMKNFIVKVETKISYNNMSFQILASDNINDRLEEYIASKGTDMLVMSAQHRNLLERIFGKSTTKEITLKTTIPLIIFHHK